MRGLVAAGAASLALLGAVQAGDDDTYQDAYRAFVAAREAGDAEAVRRHAEAAWRRGETALPPGETLAILAQNYLAEVIWRDADAAAEVAPRALALGEEGHGLSNMTLAELRIADAYAAAARGEGDPDRAAVEALAAALAADRATGRALTPFHVAAHDQAFGLAMLAGRHGLAYDLMTPLVHELRAADQPLEEAIASRDLLRAKALLVAGRRIDSAVGRKGEGGRWHRRERIRDAHVLIDHAQNAAPTFASLDAASRTAIDARTWHGVVASIAGTMGIDLTRPHRFDGLDANPEADRPFIDRPDVDDAVCEIGWRRRPMTYPRTGEGYIGGVLIGFDVGADGRVENARVLGEVPEGRFGPHVLRKVQQWEADPASFAEQPAACRRDHVTSIVFTMG